MQSWIADNSAGRAGSWPVHGHRPGGHRRDGSRQSDAPVPGSATSGTLRFPRTTREPCASPSAPNRSVRRSRPSRTTRPSTRAAPSGSQGRPPVEMIQAMCLRPEILRAFAGFGGCVYPGGILTRRESGAGHHHGVRRPTSASSAPSRIATSSTSAGILEAPLELVAAAGRPRAAGTAGRRVHPGGDARLQPIPETLWAQIRDRLQRTRDRRARVPRRATSTCSTCSTTSWASATTASTASSRPIRSADAKGAKGPAIPGPVAVVPRRPSRLRWTGATRCLRSGPSPGEIGPWRNDGNASTAMRRQHGWPMP